MATLNVNNRVLTIFNEQYNIAFTLKSKAITNLACASCPASNKPSHDPYLGLIRHCSALSLDGHWYAAAAERKLIVWSTDDWRQNCVKNLHRSASKIVFTPSNNRILVADKTGDVYAFTIVDDPPAKNNPLLGHLSIPLDILITPDEKFVITCDRDEKIRVTHYPNTHNIERFCLGHSAFVTKIILLRDNTLLSSSGDGTLKFWQYVTGECESTYCVKNDLDNSCNSDHCIITNVSAFERTLELVVCVSVFKYDGILVYACVGNANYTLNLVQVIDCCEPLDFVVCESLLWILKFSSSCLLNALSWNEDARKYCEIVPSEVKDTLKIVNENCASIITSSLDLSVLHKKFHLKEKSVVKKVKLK